MRKRLQKQLDRCITDLDELTHALDEGQELDGLESTMNYDRRNRNVYYINSLAKRYTVIVDDWRA